MVFSATSSKTQKVRRYIEINTQGKRKQKTQYRIEKEPETQKRYRKKIDKNKERYRKRKEKDGADLFTLITLISEPLAASGLSL